MCWFGVEFPVSTPKLQEQFPMFSTSRCPQATVARAGSHIGSRSQGPESSSHLQAPQLPVQLLPSQEKIFPCHPPAFESHKN